MRRIGTGAGLAMACALLSVQPGQGATSVLGPAREHTFRTPDANVRCGYTPAAGSRRARVRCDAIRTLRGVRIAAEFTPVGKARLFRPRDRVPAVARRVVRNADSVAIGPFRCTVSDGAMVCISIRSPHGFALGRAQQAPLAARAR
jgi:hypothetical protein